MANITTIYCHHSGGTATNNYASSQNLTLEDINKAHQARWSDFKSELGYYVGYNFVIFKDGSWVQTRKVGEELAAQRGYNHNSIAICVVGNFNKGVDTPTQDQVNTLQWLILSLLEGNFEQAGIKVKENTTLNLSVARIYPHRHVGQTECNGNSLPNTWARDLVLEVYGQRYMIPVPSMKVYFTMLAWLVKDRNKQLSASIHGQRECGGHL